MQSGDFLHIPLCMSIDKESYFFADNSCIIALGRRVISRDSHHHLHPTLYVSCSRNIQGQNKDVLQSYQTGGNLALAQHST